MRIDLTDEMRLVAKEIVAEALRQATKLPEDRIAYTEREAAKLLGIAWNTLRDARRRGELAGARLGKKICYERGELLAWLERQRTIG